MLVSLRQRIFRIVLAGILITASLILINVWTATSGVVRKQLDKDIAIAQSVFNRVVDDRRKALLDTTRVLLRDFGFRQAIASKDQPTITSTFESFKRRISADFMTIVDLNGDVVTSDSAFFTRNHQFPYPDMIQDALQGGAEGAITVNDELYQVVMLPILTPTPSSVACLGFALDDDFFELLKTSMQADIIMYITTASGELQIMNASMPKDKALSVVQNQQSSISWLDVTVKNRGAYITQPLQWSQMVNADVKILLAADATEQYESFSQLQITIIGISILAILVTLLMTFWLSRRVSQPLASLVDAVKYIAEGNYHEEIAVKGRLREIRSLGTAFTSMRDSIRSREERIRYQAQHDMLTGLYNRNYVEQWVNDALTAGRPFQAIAVNLQGFRTINDLYGFANGDVCLKTTSARLETMDGVAARLSGGELLWIPATILSHDKLLEVKALLETPVETDGLVIPIKMTLGVLNCPEQAATAEEIFRKINIVIDDGEHGFNALTFYDPEIENRYIRRLTIITELKRALSSAQDELYMVYQPKVDLKSNQVTGVEALIRWVNSSLGFIPPDEFIGIAENAGLIDQITMWVAQQVIEDLRRFRQAGYPITAAINFSTQDIQNAELLETFTQRLRDAGFASNDVVLEITESDLVADADTAINNLNNLKSQGFALAIDDFGTGYSSLAYLKHLPVSTVKIDKSFVLNLSTDHDDQQIVKTIIALANVFGLSVVAEGVENKDAMRMLSDFGCDIAQGYYISRPVKCCELIDWLGDYEKTNAPHSITSNI